ncbi:arylamine N-acetyltransferase 1 [Byssothecium circinans]|uniref:Arylamine N-acetyltransferase 1 n=1 Tax=Byssothecium circinans TaxID=147558 RepID=A0A6A5TJ99_9PLEO|nr:arylamine N-acetyltransferase 1 [Byssothecium circinans]
MSSDQQRPTYTRSQIAQYFDRLILSEEQRNYDAAGLKPVDALAYLGLLQKHHLAEIPFENLTLHYSPHRQVCLHPEELFKKIIGDGNGRGGYCMENNGLFGTLLYSLGFNVYSAGARVYTGHWTGWSHMVNIVKIGDMKYEVDVGFGGNGPTVPMPLDRSGTVQQHIRPGTACLRWQNIVGNTDPEQRLWVYHHRKNDSSDFEMTYCFTELEFLPSDYQVMNYFTSTSMRTFFTRTVVMEKKLLGADGELEGTLTINQDTLKWRMHGTKQKEIKFRSEADRVKALEEHFGIVLSAVEREGISGLPSQFQNAVF